MSCVGRYFVVIDDIWDINILEELKLAFLENNHGSRILTTTPQLDVAREAGDVYMLEPLSYDNSKILFYTKIFGDLGSCPDDDVLDKILIRCGGVPLAIITMASLLASKPREKWFQVYTSTRFSDNKDNQYMDNTLRILSYCCYDMPSYLRTCLLYTSIYPAGYTINKDYLIWKWVAEGFVHDEHGIGLFELGERYFFELMNRGMIQPVHQERQAGYVDSCCVHDMVHSLIRSLSCKENLFTILDHEQDTTPPNNMRRISYQRRKVEDGPHAQIGMPSMRSFIACCSEFPKMVVPISNFHALRVLALERCYFMKSYHLTHLGKLLQLRYLGLAGTPICELPVEIVALKLLQTLDLAETGIKQLPSSIGQLTQLMRLRGMFATKAPVDGTIMKLTSLEELWIDPPAANDEGNKTAEKFVVELGNLKKLRVLATNIPAALDENLEEALLQSIRNMPNLHYLFVQFLSSGVSLKLQAPSFVPPKYIRYLWLGGIDFLTMPEWINSSLLPHLCFLMVCIKDLEAQEMLTLGMLPELCCLHLFTTSIFSVHYGGGYFQKLRSLCLGRATFSRDKFGDPTILPSLEDLHFAIDVGEMKHICNYYGQSISSFLSTLVALHSIPMLVKVQVKLFCEDATSRDVEEIEAALKHIVHSHGNHPILETQRENEDRMTTSDSGQQVSTCQFCLCVFIYTSYVFPLIPVFFNGELCPGLEHIYGFNVAN
jgi:disease resistance protein RPM1